MLSLAPILSLALATSAAPAAGDGVDFTTDVQLLYRVVACAGTTPLPANVDAKVVEAHCAKIKPHMDKYRQKYADEAKAFISAIRPAGSPTTLVYPFGGGDLLSALTTFPDATDITTLSLEHAGDPRRLARGIDKSKQAVSLENVRRMIAGLLLYNDSKTESLQKLQRGEIPGQIAFFVVALAVHGYEPTRLRYFRAEKDGKVHYIDEADLAAAEQSNAKMLRRGWVSPDFSEAFSNAEIEFRPIGGGPTRVHHHFGADLSNGVQEKDPSILKYLEAKGRISAMTKAASYLLWRNDFSLVRDYLLSHMEVMISDSTGIPPRFATAAGFTQETWGKFEQSFLGASPEHNADFVKLWKSFPDRKLPFRYGYIDGSPGKHFHMLLTKKIVKAEVAQPDGGVVLATFSDGSVPDAGYPAHAGADGGFLFTDGGIAKLWLPRAEGETPRLDHADVVLGGEHTRLITSRGVAHLWRPAGYDAKKAGTVVYLHGYWVNSDQAWTEYKLAEQFRGSERNALFVVPESPAEDADAVQWPDLGELLHEVRHLAHLAMPDGPIIAVAHSGGFRTVLGWLGEKRLQQVVILDGMYRPDTFHAWIRDQKGHHVRRLTMVSADTLERAERVASRLPGARRIEQVPETVAELGSARHAEVVSMRSQYDHMAIVTGGKVIPLVLQMTPLPRV